MAALISKLMLAACCEFGLCDESAIDPIALVYYVSLPIEVQQ